MLKHLTIAAALFMASDAQAASTVPNDCWFGVMAVDNAPHGRLVATGQIKQWRVGTPLVIYPTIEDYSQIEALEKQGKIGTYDTSHPITVIPTWISGPEPGDQNNSDEKNSIEVSLQYQTADGETGGILLTYWTPMAAKYTSLPPDQQTSATDLDWMLHDMVC